jgi:hypothetical protein
MFASQESYEDDGNYDQITHTITHDKKNITLFLEFKCIECGNLYISCKPILKRNNNEIIEISPLYEFCTDNCIKEYLTNNISKNLNIFVLPLDENFKEISNEEHTRNIFEGVVEIYYFLKNKKMEFEKLNDEMVEYVNDDIILYDDDFIYLENFLYLNNINKLIKYLDGNYDDVYGCNIQSSNLIKNIIQIFGDKIKFSKIKKYIFQK